MTISVGMTVNGKSVSGKVEARTLLVQFLREHLGMTGTHVGCDTSQCGACVVHVDGKSVKSCTMLAAQAEGSEIVTIEGLANGELHPMQAAFREHHGLQCGFCTPGMVMSAVDRVRHIGNPVAVVIGETKAAARDAAELIEVDYEILPSVVAATDALKPGAPQLFEAASGNLCYDWHIGDKAQTDAAFAKAAH